MWWKTISMFTSLSRISRWDSEVRHQPGRTLSLTPSGISIIFRYSGFLSMSVFPTFTHICDFLTSTGQKITKKFELESEEEKKKIHDSYSAIFENFNREKEVTAQSTSMVESAVWVGPPVPRGTSVMGQTFCLLGHGPPFPASLEIYASRLSVLLSFI